MGILRICVMFRELTHASVAEVIMVFFRCCVWRDVGSMLAIAILAAATSSSRVCVAQTVSDLSLPDSPGATSSSVQAVEGGQQVAPEQAKGENNPLHAGMFQNFYTSYVWEAAPLSAKQKYSLAGRSLGDPVMFATIAAAAAVQQADNSYAGYGQGAQGYGKRYGADLADTASDRMLGGAVLPSLLHQDPRYFYKGTGSAGSRLRYALGEAFLCRGDNGQRQVNYSTIGGTLMTAGLSNAYRAEVDRNASTTFINAAVIFGGHMANNAIREFLLKRMMTTVTP